jgi:hypothetical protein
MRLFSNEGWWEHNHKGKNGESNGYKYPYKMVQGKDYDVNSIMRYYSQQGI